MAEVMPKGVVFLGSALLVVLQLSFVAFTFVIIVR